jgi:predicted MPP superfamily phosphohydrolase
MPFAIKVILVLLSVLILEIYFVKRVIHSTFILFPNISKKKVKIAKWISLTLVNIYPVAAILAWIYVYVMRMGYFAPPQNFFFDYFVLYPFWIGTMIIVQATLFFILFEVINLLVMPFVEKGRRVKLTSTVLFIIFAVTVIYVPIRIIYDYNSVEIRNVTYEKENLPESLEGFKIAFISDIQADRYTSDRRLSNYIEKLNSTDPDLVLMAGDMITSTPNFINTSAQYLGKIKSKHGSYTCVGDHDNWAYRGNKEKSLSEITEALNSVNIPMIDNDKLVLGIDSANIEVTFVTNTYVERANNIMLNSITKNDNKADLRIFLTHQPRQFLIDKAVENKYDLYLCGHTHGGQITFFFPFYNLSPTLAETTYMRGDFWFKNTLMIVTRGLGMSLAPVRFNSTPEITLISLKSGTN